MSRLDVDDDVHRRGAAGMALPGIGVGVEDSTESEKGPSQVLFYISSREDQVELEINK